MPELSSKERAGLNAMYDNGGVMGTVSQADA